MTSTDISKLLAADDWRSLAETEALLEQELAERRANQPWRNYPADPVGYARDVLGVTLTPDQQTFLRALLEPPFKVKVESGHNIGKTFLAAVAANWWYDSFDPGVVITTAPTERDVIDLLWTEIRLLRGKAKGPALGDRKLPDDFIGPAAPEMRTSEEHWAKGYTARKGESFQGRHRKRMLFIFDEDEGIEPSYFKVLKTMFKPELFHGCLSIGNPTTTTSASYLESQTLDLNGEPSWRVFSMSALNHPNVVAELAGLPPPIPDAVSVGQIDTWVGDWCERIDPAIKEPTDIEWRPGSGNWFRPGPDFEARALGRRPSQGTHGVWSAALWAACEERELEIDLGTVPEIGCDCAWKGDDYSGFHVRWGGVSIRHESFNGWMAPRIAMHLKELCKWAAALANQFRDPNARPIGEKEIPVKIDDDATGGAVIALSEGYRFIPVSAVTASVWRDRYPNKRSELWFATRERALAGLLSVKPLPQGVRDRLKIQLLAPTWEPTPSGQRQVEPKKKTKEKINRSPDDADAFNLAYCDGSNATAFWIDPAASKNPATAGGKYGILGRTEAETQTPADDDYEDRPRVSYGILGR